MADRNNNLGNGGSSSRSDNRDLNEESGLDRSGTSGDDLNRDREGGMSGSESDRNRDGGISENPERSRSDSDIGESNR